MTMNMDIQTFISKGIDMALAKPQPKEEAQEEMELGQQEKVEQVGKEEVQETTSTEVSTQTQSTAVATQGSGNFQQQMADQGLEGLELGFGSFPILKIVNEGKFEDEDENDYGEQFVAVVQSTRIKHLYKQAGVSEGDVSYSYDGVNLLSASENGAATVEALKAEYEELGYSLEVKDYLEVVVTMQDPESDFDGEMFILSIPPASRTKFSGVVATMQLKGKDVKTTPILFSVGKKRKSKGGSNYFPWSFKIA